MLLSARQLFEEAVSRLRKIYDGNEAQSIAFTLLKYKFHVEKAMVLAGKTITLADPADWQHALLRLERQEPVQYVIGETEFYGLSFKVNPQVLIPRPETEELVDWVVREHRGRTIRVLDIGTGSGCIAVSLAKSLPQAQVWALDVSAGALETAQANAKRNQVDVKFLEADILAWDTITLLRDQVFDVVVSNPPYVTQAEKTRMHGNVTDFEPHLALFVPDTDPLLFYRRIAQFCREHLQPGGTCYLEINEQFARQTESVLLEAGLTAPSLHIDFFGKPRHIKAVCPTETK